MASQAAKAISRIPPFPWDGAVNWFPGHMNKAIKNIKSSLKLVDTIIEVRDARVSSKPFLIIIPVHQYTQFDVYNTMYLLN